jgi:hypothetical protein
LHILLPSQYGARREAGQQHHLLDLYCKAAPSSLMTTIHNYYTYLPLQGSCFFVQSKGKKGENKLENKKEKRGRF